MPKRKPEYWIVPKYLFSEHCEKKDHTLPSDLYSIEEVQSTYSRSTPPLMFNGKILTFVSYGAALEYIDALDKEFLERQMKDNKTTLCNTINEDKIATNKSTSLFRQTLCNYSIPKNPYGNVDIEQVAKDFYLYGLGRVLKDIIRQRDELGWSIPQVVDTIIQNIIDEAN